MLRIYDLAVGQDEVKFWNPGILVWHINETG
jgi:hypothetical protein